VPISTLAHVVADHVPGPVDFLKVDVDGFEREVLAGADWSRFRPRVGVMEATGPKSDEPAHEAREAMLFDVGYRFAMFDGLNRFYAHADEPALLEMLAIPANVFDDFGPYAWSHQVDQPQQWAHSLGETLTERGDQLNAAELRTARALAEIQHVRTELHALKVTRTFRYTALTWLGTPPGSRTGAFYRSSPAHRVDEFSFRSSSAD
jgi:hypothetical protein